MLKFSSKDEKKLKGCQSLACRKCRCFAPNLATATPKINENHINIMYFLYELERVITLHPSFFGPRVKEYLTNRLLEDVEGTCTGQYYIICVMDAYDISEGRVVPGSAVAEYTVHYRAVVWRPFKGETVGLTDQYAERRLRAEDKFYL